MSAATAGLICDWCRDSDGRPLLRPADKPCWGLNGTDYRMGANGAVQGDINHYGDYVYSQEAMKIISEHDLQIPLYFCAQLRRTFTESPSACLLLFNLFIQSIGLCPQTSRSNATTNRSRPLTRTSRW